MENANFTIFGFKTNQVKQLQYIGNYNTEEHAFNDISNLEKALGYSHYVIYGNPNHNCDNEMFKFHGWFKRVIEARRPYSTTEIKVMSWCPTRYFTNDYKTFYFQ